MSAAAYAEQAMALFSELAYDTTLGRHADIRYGLLPAHTLDIYLPFKVGAQIERLSVLVFIHGGGFTQGRKEWNAFMASLMATVPPILVNISYRLIPSVQWPVPLDDCRLAVDWVRTHVEGYGVEPNCRFVGGHSAGAARATLLALEPHGSRLALRGVVNLSGSFNRLAITGTARSDSRLPQGPMPIVANAPLAKPLSSVVPTAFLMIWGRREAQIERVERSTLAMLGRMYERE